jgi:hypothetical protein
MPSAPVQPLVRSNSFVQALARSTTTLLGARSFASEGGGGKETRIRVSIPDATRDARWTMVARRLSSGAGAVNGMC